MIDDGRSLLAKTWKHDNSQPPEATLEGHLHEVFCCAETIVSITGDRQLEAFGLQVNEWRERLGLAVRLAAAIHDIGKANSHFQSLLGGDPTFPPIRYEWLSVWFAQQPAVTRWLMSAVDGDERVWRCVLCAVAGHHPKLGRVAPQARQETSTSRKGHAQI